MSQTAKIFANGRSQAVRLPAEFRFDSKEVFIRRNEETGDVILSRRPSNWEGFLNSLKDVEVPADFFSLDDRQQGQQARDPFEGEDK
jgi:antitoxin VapB